ncbi:MAG: Fic family protein [Candidatus Nanohalobium sp.]
MEDLEVDCSRIEELVSEDQVITANYLVTDPEGLFSLTEDVDSGPTREIIRGLQERFESFEVSREEDYFEVRNRGALEGLVQTRLRYECGENNGFIHLAAFIMKALAENQVFGDGNKRTAYLTGTMFLVKYQIDVLGRDEAVIPELEDELVTILQDLAVGETDLGELERYLSTVEKDIKNL